MKAILQNTFHPPTTSLFNAQNHTNSVFSWDFRKLLKKKKIAMVFSKKNSKFAQEK